MARIKTQKLLNYVAQAYRLSWIPYMSICSRICLQLRQIIFETFLDFNLEDELELEADTYFHDMRHMRDPNCTVLPETPPHLIRCIPPTVIPETPLSFTARL